MDARSATDVVDRLLPDATHLTNGQLRARLQRLCLEADPHSALDRMKQSLTQRRVVAEPNSEGTATLIISECPPADVYAARDHINYLARRLKTADEPRTIDQLRADVALALLSGSALSGSDRTGTVNLNVDYASGGRTLVSNQTPLCRRHHRAKHVGKWRYRKTARTRMEWTSPLGHTYHTAKPPYGRVRPGSAGMMTR